MQLPPGMGLNYMPQLASRQYQNDMANRAQAQNGSMLGLSPTAGSAGMGQSMGPVGGNASQPQQQRYPFVAQNASGGQGATGSGGAQQMFGVGNMPQTSGGGFKPQQAMPQTQQPPQIGQPSMNAMGGNAPPSPVNPTNVPPSYSAVAANSQQQPGGDMQSQLNAMQRQTQNAIQPNQYGMYGSGQQAGIVGSMLGYGSPNMGGMQMVQNQINNHRPMGQQNGIGMFGNNAMPGGDGSQLTQAQGVANQAAQPAQGQEVATRPQGPVYNNIYRAAGSTSPLQMLANNSQQKPSKFVV